MLLDLLKPTATDDGRVFKLLALEREGITQAQVASLQKRYALSDQDLLYLLSINTRTFQRRRSGNQRLTVNEGAIFLEVARVFAFASSVFEDDEKVIRWIKRPNRTLNNEPPITLLSTSTGRSMVQDVLGRIDYGIFA